MKLKVNRKLTEGRYWVDFAATEFTPEEIRKMESFGVPTIKMILSQRPEQQQPVMVQVTKIGPIWKAAFPGEEEAKKYEETVINQVRDAMKYLREKVDDFTKTEEVEL